LVEVNKEFGYINKKGKYLINSQLDAAGLVKPFSFRNGLALLEFNGKIRYINKEGQFVFQEK
jgi:transglutaminase/protease-like cytokinesis protein 3